MRKNVKIEDNNFLISQEIVKENATIEMPKCTNHIFVVDVSYSMSRDLPLIRKQLKNKLSNVMRDGDTISIVWFSGQHSAGVLKEEVEVKSLKTLTDLHDAIDKWLKPVGMTAFLKPLEITQDIIKRILVNRPESVFSLIFLTDGYNNNCSWDSVISELSSLESQIASSTFVEYGYYADTQKLTQMAAIMGGEKVATSDFDEFEPVFNSKLSTGTASTKKVVVPIEGCSMYDFAYTVDNGSVLLYNIKDGNVVVGNSVDRIFFFSETEVGTSYSTSYTEEDVSEVTTALYAAIYILSDKLMNFEAEKLFYPLGDNYHYKMLLNAFGKQKLNAFKTSIKDCVTNVDARFPEGSNEIKQVQNDAYCLMNLVTDLGKSENCLFYPSHDSFDYNRIGRKMKKKGSELSDKDKLRLSEAKNVAEAAEILKELSTNNVDINFEATDPNKGYPITDLVWNEERANLSVRCRIDGVVTLPKNDYEIDKVSTFRYTTYTLIKDGIVNVEKLPVRWSKSLEDSLLQNGVDHDVHHPTTKDESIIIIIDLTSLPLINRSMVTSMSAKKLGELEWELKKLQGDNKVYNYFRKELFPKESTTFIDSIGKEAADWLKTVGVTDYNGFAPKRIAAESTDSYMSVNLATKIKGLSSLPKVEIVAQKLQDGKKLKLNEWVMSAALSNYILQQESEIYQTLDEAQQDMVLKNYITKKSAELVKKKRDLMQTVAQIKFSLILSKKWFDEFNSFDENKIEMNIDGQDLSFTFDLSEKEVKM